MGTLPLGGDSFYWNHQISVIDQAYKEYNKIYEDAKNAYAWDPTDINSQKCIELYNNSNETITKYYNFVKNFEKNIASIPSNNSGNNSGGGSNGGNNSGGGSNGGNNNGGDDDTQKSHIWFIIIIIFLVLLVAAGGYVLYKHWHQHEQTD